LDNVFGFKRAAFFQSLKSKVGLAAAKAAALRIILNIDGCSILAPPIHAPSRTTLLLPLLPLGSIWGSFLRFIETGFRNWLAACREQGLIKKVSLRLNP
jgi:hypothetical protein